VGQAPFFPLGIGTIAATLRAAGIEAHIYYPENDPPGAPPPIIDKASVFENRKAAHRRYLAALADPGLPVWRELLQVLERLDPDVVGVSVLSSEVGSALMVSRLAKEQRPDRLVVWGGVHPSFLPDECLSYPEVDVVVRGEGEQTMLELCQAWNHRSIDGIPGISHRRGNRIVHEPDRELIADLDSLPLPAREAALFPERFNQAAWGALITSRGCPWRCGFCSSRLFWHKIVRFRSPANVVAEIREVQRRFGIHSFIFWDDAFTMEMDRSLALCEEILAANLRITWRTATRIDLLSPRLLRLMRRAGCTQVEVGVESGSPRMLRAMVKDIEIEQVPEKLELVRKHGIACGTFFMAGFPGETEEDLRQTHALMQRIRPAEIVLNVFDPMPGSELFEEARRLGLLPDPIDWTAFPLWPDAHYVKNIPPQRFTELVEAMAADVFRYNRSPGALYRRIKPEAIHLLLRDRRTLWEKMARRIPGLRPRGLTPPSA
jgi:radical SAM superfamily enzyme YgiQ (UPF0313 family)